MSRWSLIVGDAIEEMRRLPDRSAAVFVTDPPYARAGAVSTGRSKSNESHMDLAGADQFWLYWFRDVAAELKRVASTCGFIFCDWRTVHLVETAIASGGDGWSLSQCLVWDREAIGLGSPFRASHELIAFCRGPEFVWTGPKNIGNVLRFRWPYGAHPHHSAEKPVPLLRFLIELISEPGEVVLDAFAGSGSTLVAAQETGRRFVGIEASEAFAAVATARIEAAAAQPDLLADVLREPEAPKSEDATDPRQPDLFGASA